MGLVQSLTLTVALAASALLAFVVLLQEPRGVGIAAALGGSGLETVGVARSGVNRFTCWVAGVWMVACLSHAILIGA